MSLSIMWASFSFPSRIWLLGHLYYNFAVFSFGITYILWFLNILLLAFSDSFSLILRGKLGICILFVVVTSLTYSLLMQYPISAFVLVLHFGLLVLGQCQFLSWCVGSLEHRLYGLVLLM